MLVLLCSRIFSKKRKQHSRTFSRSSAGFRLTLRKLLTRFSQLLEMALSFPTIILQAAKDSHKVFKSLEELRWNSYRSYMRGNGACSQGDVNAELTKSILPFISNSWNLGVNNRIPSILEDFTHVSPHLMILHIVIAEHICRISK